MLELQAPPTGWGSYVGFPCPEGQGVCAAKKKDFFDGGIGNYIWANRCQLILEMSLKYPKPVGT